MSRRLVNRARSSGTTESATPAPAGLPQYEPLQFPLDDEGRRALQALSTDRKQGRYIRNLKAGATNLGTCTGDIQDRLRTRKTHLATQQRRRKVKGEGEEEEGAEDLSKLEQHLEDYARTVDERSRESEAALRLLLDRQAELEDEAGVITDVYMEATDARAEENTRLLQKQRRREEAIEIAQARGEEIPPEEDEGGEGEEEQLPPVQSALQSFRSRQDDKRREYEQMTAHQRYALNNDYASFKKQWHDGAQGEDGPPLPDASRWFRADGGEPVLPTVAPRAGGRGRSRTVDQGHDDSDDEIAVAREVTSLRCPLSLAVFVEPYSNNKCKHTFEKSAILDYLPRSGQVQCPQTGCSEVRDYDGVVLQLRLGFLWCAYGLLGCFSVIRLATFTFTSANFFYFFLQVFTRANFEKDFYLDHAIQRRLQRRNVRNRLEDMDMDVDEDEDDDGKSMVDFN